MTASDAGRAPALDQPPALRIVAGGSDLTPIPDGSFTCGAAAFVRAQLPLRFGHIRIDGDAADSEYSDAWWRFFVHSCAAHLLPGATMVLDTAAVGEGGRTLGASLIARFARSTGLEATTHGPVHRWERTRRRTVHDLVAEARSGLDRLSPEALAGLLAADPSIALLDSRTPTDRETDGVIAGSVHVPRTVLEWAVDPASGYALDLVPDARLVVVCNEGYSSSLAARALHDLGFANATDLIGGMQAWRSAGLPVVDPDGHHGRCLLPEESDWVAAISEARPT